MSKLKTFFAWLIALLGFLTLCYILYSVLHTDYSRKSEKEIYELKSMKIKYQIDSLKFEHLKKVYNYGN